MEERGLLGLSETAWNDARHRRDIISALARRENVGHEAANKAAAQLGISRRQVYRLLQRYREGAGLVTDLAPLRSDGGKGKTRIAPDVNRIIYETIETFYLSRQKRSEAALVREVRMRCSEAAYRSPARNTISGRVRSLDPKLIVERREGADNARRLSPAVGKMPPPAHPLDVVQMDHTPVDVIVVDEQSREPIGRPILTLAIDVATRCIVGMLLTLEAPSATSVGLCLAHVVTDKRNGLLQFGLIDVTWPMHGKPRKIHLDNAPEFHSEALKRGCEQHAIERDYRPKGQPHYGGIIERVIGTAMKLVHELPGTTFSNPAERGDYDSEAKAILTLREMEKWLTLSIATYHESFHSALQTTPAARWKAAVENHPVYTMSDGNAFLIDFLPVVYRRVSRTGFVIDHISYYAELLKPWITRRDRLGQFVLRRDPRNLSRVWVLDPSSKKYIEIPYRSIANPTVTLWEHKKAIERLRELGRAEVNEQAIFRMIGQMREITDGAALKRKRARRDPARRSHLSVQSEPPVVPLPPNAIHRLASIKCFDDIEEW